MKTYDPKKLELIKGWIKLVESKRQTIRNVMGYAKQVYEATEQMNSWYEIRYEFEMAKHKLMKIEETNLPLKDKDNDGLKKEKEEKERILASIPKNKFWELRAEALLKIKNDPKMKYMLKNFDPTRGLGKAMVETEICKAFENETRT